MNKAKTIFTALEVAAVGIAVESIFVPTPAFVFPAAMGQYLRFLV
jgi:hypothetical protein